MENIKKVYPFLAAAILVEAIITYFNQFIILEHFNLSMFLSIGIGIIVAIAYKLDLFSFINLESRIPWVGNILTGILIARGSNYIFDVLTKISSI